MASASASEFTLFSTQTALALIVPSHLQPELNTIRKIHDKAYRKWEPHINILYPFVDASLLSSAITTLRIHLSSHPIASFKIKIEDVGVFEHTRSSTVFLKPGEESEEIIARVRSSLVAALGRSEGEGTRDGIFRPHLTMGQASLIGPTKDRLVHKVEKLVGVEWEVERLVVLRRQATGEMVVVEEISLQGDGGDESNSQITEPQWRKCYKFRPDIGWDQEIRSNYCPSKPSMGPFEVTISSYNLMSEPHAPRFSRRLPHIVAVISKAMLRTTSSTQILCLQEVSEEMLPLILGDSKLQALFPFSTHGPSSDLPNKRNLISMSNALFFSYTLPFPQRYKSSLVIYFPNKSIQVANIHLTRALTNEAIAAKKCQMGTLTNLFTDNRLSKNIGVFVVGDFNLTTSSRTLETALARGIITPTTAQQVGEVVDSEVWNDAFIVCGNGKEEVDGEGFYEGEQGATFDRLKNPLATMSKVVIDNRPQRYDRILFKKGDYIHASSFEVFGRPTEDGTCLSDHYGVCATFQIDRMNDASANTETGQQVLCNVRIVEDSTDIKPLIEPYLPTAADRKQREEALEIFRSTLSSNQSLADLIIAPLGSYAMETYFTDSDVDILVIATVSPQFFFNFATDQLRAISLGDKDIFKGIHFVNSLVSIIEVNIRGIKFDIQYCQAAALVKRYHSTSPPTPLETLIFDASLIQSLPPTSLRPLNTYRSTIYLLTTLPSLESYCMAHRFIALYLMHHGLYSAKFGYLGGIHLSLLLNHLLKVLSLPQGSSLTPATIIRKFFEYYSKFDWAHEEVCDPELEILEGKKGLRVERTTREVLVIRALHLPAARPNVAASCTRLAAVTISGEFTRARSLLEKGDWEACLSSHDASLSKFFSGYGAYVRICVEVWELEEFGWERVRDGVGGVESRIVKLLVELGGIEEVEARAWPERFCAADEEKKNDLEDVFKCCFLVGVKAREENDELKRVVSGKVIMVVRGFEKNLRQRREADKGNMLICANVVSKRKVAEMRLIVDRRK